MSNPTQPFDEYFIRVNYPESELGGDTILVKFPYSSADDLQWHYERVKLIAKHLQAFILKACDEGCDDRADALISAVDLFNETQKKMVCVCTAEVVLTVASVDVPEPNEPK